MKTQKTRSIIGSALDKRSLKWLKRNKGKNFKMCNMIDDEKKFAEYKQWLKGESLGRKLYYKTPHGLFTSSKLAAISHDISVQELVRMVNDPRNKKFQRSTDPKYTKTKEIECKKCGKKLRYSMFSDILETQIRIESPKQICVTCESNRYRLPSKFEVETKAGKANARALESIDKLERFTLPNGRHEDKELNKRDIRRIVKSSKNLIS